MRAVLALIAVLTTSACVAPTTGGAPAVTPAPAANPNVPVSVARAIEVTRRMEPVAEAICRAETPRRNCDFNVLVNRDPRGGVNAFQTVDPETGQPIIILTVGLIRAVRNADELAFVIGHEAAHHIAGHIDAQREAAQIGARILSARAQSLGATDAEILEAAQAGAFIGARRFSQSAELEADALGTLIACRAGFDPILGARFFDQLRDPGEQILGTHPPNAARIDIVRRTAGEGCR